MFLICLILIPITFVCCSSDEPGSNESIDAVDSEKTFDHENQHSDPKDLFEHGLMLQARAKFVDAEHQYRQAFDIQSLKMHNSTFDRIGSTCPK